MHALTTFIRKMTSGGPAPSPRCAAAGTGGSGERASARSGARCWRRRAWLGALSLALAAWMPAHAEINQLNFRNSYDGTPGWDPVAGNGLDTDPNNRIVRTNDQFEYLVTFSTDGGGDDNLTLVSTLPLGNVAPRIGQPVARWTNLPANCTGPGSAISADGQTLTCNLGNIGGSGTQSVFFNATVLGSTPHGTGLPAPSLVGSSSATPTFPPSQMPDALVVTAAPFYDVVVQMSHNGNPRAYGFMPGGGPADEDGFFHRPLVGLVAKNPNGNGNKGVEQLDPAIPVHYDMDLSGYPAGMLLDNWHTATGTFGSGCGSPNNGSPNAESGGAFNMFTMVGDSGGNSSTSPTIVPNGGVCANPVQAGSNISFDVGGIDTTLRRRPTTAGGSGTPVPPSQWWVSNKGLVLWTPVTSYPPNVQVSHLITLGSVTGTSISGQPITGDDLSNNSASYQLRTLDSGNASKLFGADASLPVPRQTQCDPAIVGDCHTNYMTPTQTVRSRIIYGNSGTVTHNNAYLCEIIDRTAYDIGANFSATTYWSNVAATPPAPTIRYGAKAGGPYFASTDTATDPYTSAAAGNPVGTSDYARARCNDPGIQWFSTPAEAQAAGGLVYVRADVPEVPGGASAGMYVAGLILRDTWAATISVLAPVATTRVAGQPIPEGTILRNEGDVGSQLASLDGANIRDHLQVVRIRTTSRVAKSVINPANGETAPQPVGSTLTYRLQPRYSTYFPPVAGTYTVTDILPPNLTYEPGSATVGGVAQEPAISFDTPAAGYTRLVWTLPAQMPYLGADGPAANLATIEFRATIALTAPDSAVLPNSVAVSGGTSDYEADCVYNTTSHNFGTCVKASAANVSVQTPPGFQVQKTSLTPLIEPGMNFGYRVTYVSFGAEMPQRDIPDFIDILPFVGDGASNPANSFAGRSPPSNFNPGAYRLVSVTVPTNDPGMRVYYTNRAPTQIHNDPRHASNAIPAGATRWCTAAELGSAGCPAAIGDSTAVRVSPAVTQLSAGTIYSLELMLASDVAIARQGNVFANSVGGRSPDPASELLFVSARANPGVQVVDSSIAGLVFRDDNDDGVHDAGETGIGGVEITLHGCSVGPDGVLQTASIPETGALSCSGDDLPVTRTMATNADGTYLFGGLSRGVYRITEAQPDGYRDGKRHVGSVGGTANAQGTVPSVITDIQLPLGTDATEYDFGEIRNANVTVAKAANPSSGTAVVPGGTITYTVTVTVADAPTMAAITLTDTLGAGLTLVSGSFTTPTGASCSAAGQSVTCELPAGAAVGPHAFTYEVTVDAGATGTVTNTVVPSGGDNPTCTTTADCTTEHPVTPPVVTVAKAANPASGTAVLPGQTITYVVTVTVADAPTTEVVTLTDTLGTGLTLVSGSFTTPTGASCSAAGQVVTCELPAGAAVGPHEFRYQVLVDATARGTVTNTVVPGGGDDPACATAADCTTENTVTPASIVVSKTANPASGNAVVPGNTITYTVTVTVADAPTTAVVTLADTLGAGLTLVANSFTTPTGASCSAAGQVVTCELPAGAVVGAHAFSYQVTVDAGASGAVTNTVVPGGDDDPTCATAADCTTEHPVTPPVVTVVKAANPVSGSPVVPGDTITYTVTVTVADAPTTAMVTLADTLGAGLSLVANSFTTPTGASCSAAGQLVTCELPAGAAVGTHAFSYQATVDAGANGAVINTVVPSGSDDPTCATVADCTTEHPVTPPVVTVAKVAVDLANGTAVLPGQTITYTVTVTVADAQTTAVVTLVDTLGAGLTLVPNSFTTPTGASCSAAGQVATCELPAGAAVGTHAFSYQATVNAGVAAPVINTVVPGGGDTPTCVADDDCQTSHPIEAVLTLDKSLVGAVRAVEGSADEFAVTYILTARNIGGSAGTYTLVDTPGFDPDVEILSATAQRGTESVQSLTGSGPWTLATGRELAAGASEAYTVAVHVRVQAGSESSNDSCGSGAGNGLYNAARLTYGETTLDDDACADTPVPSTASQLVLEKTSPVREAEVGDVVVYTIRIRNNGPGIALQPILVDRLPAGFQLVGETVRVRGASLLSLTGEPGPMLRMALDRIDPGAEVLVQYRVRLGVGAQQGDGINRAHMECGAGTALAQCSNEGRWQVKPRGGVFSNEGCVVGQIYVDANGNFLKDGEELGIPGVRLYFQDGTYLISDVEGKYSYCGLRPVTHVLKVDSRTLPRGSRLVTSSSRNAGDANSLFIDLKNGELHRADFIEGSASNEVLEQVKARRAAGEIRSVETEAGQPGLKFESKPAPQGTPLQQGTDSARQPIEQTRNGDPDTRDP